MLLRNTLMFIPKGEVEVIKVMIYTSEIITENGVWNIDNNKVILSDKLYNEYRGCKTQNEQRKFFAQLKQVSNQLL
ncbi:MAG: hypothetical protein H0U39_01125 [Segetibacter sp.]|nr:hypothetical protein [Segetibacter sp.]